VYGCFSISISILRFNSFAPMSAILFPPQQYMNEMPLPPESIKICQTHSRVNTRDAFGIRWKVELIQLSPARARQGHSEQPFQYSEKLPDSL
jgi:hypothetical protein